MTEKKKVEMDPQVLAAKAAENKTADDNTPETGKAKAVPKKKRAAKTTGKAESSTKVKSKSGKKEQRPWPNT